MAEDGDQVAGQCLEIRGVGDLGSVVCDPGSHPGNAATGTRMGRLIEDHRSMEDVAFEDGSEVLRWGVDVSQFDRRPQTRDRLRHPVRLVDVLSQVDGDLGLGHRVDPALTGHRRPRRLCVRFRQEPDQRTGEPELSKPLGSSEGKLPADHTSGAFQHGGVVPDRHMVSAS